MGGCDLLLGNTILCSLLEWIRTGVCPFAAAAGSGQEITPPIHSIHLLSSKVLVLAAYSVFP